MRLTLGAAGLTALACAENPPPETGPAGNPDESVAARPASRPPSGGRSPADTTGFLDRDDITVRMAGEGLIVDVLPMDAEVVALATDDLRRFLDDALRKVPDTVPPDLKRDGTYFLIGFSATEKEIAFEPSRLALNSEGRQYYPGAIVPISRGFESRILRIFAPPVWAVYIFDPVIDQTSTLEFTYGDALSTGVEWRQVVQAVELARSRASSR